MPTNEEIFKSSMNTLSNKINTKAGTSTKSTVDGMGTKVDSIPVLTPYTLPELYEAVKEAWEHVTVSDILVDAIRVDGAVAPGLCLGSLNNLPLLYDFFTCDEKEHTIQWGSADRTIWTNIGGMDEKVNMWQTLIDNVDQVYEYMNDYYASPVYKHVYQALVNYSISHMKKPPKIPYICVGEGALSPDGTYSNWKWDWHSESPSYSEMNNSLYGFGELLSGWYFKLCVYIPYDFEDGQGESVCRIRFTLQNNGNTMDIIDPLTGDTYSDSVYDAGDIVDVPTDHKYAVDASGSWVTSIYNFDTYQAAWAGFISNGIG